MAESNIVLRASCLKLEIREISVMRQKVKKAGSRRESNPEHLWLEPSVLCH